MKRILLLLVLLAGCNSETPDQKAQREQLEIEARKAYITRIEGCNGKKVVAIAANSACVEVHFDDGSIFYVWAVPYTKGEVRMQMDVKEAK